jgi:hypothetical protein
MFIPFTELRLVKAIITSMDFSAFRAPVRRTTLQQTTHTRTHYLGAGINTKQKIHTCHREINTLDTCQGLQSLKGSQYITFPIDEQLNLSSERRKM